MNETRVRELLERASASITPAEGDAARRLAHLGRRRVRRRRGVLAGAATTVAAAAAVAVVAGDVRLGPTDPPVATRVTVQQTLTWGGVRVAVPDGWQVERVGALLPCTARPRTLYLAQEWQAEAEPCPRVQGPWIGLAERGDGLMVPPGPTVQHGRALLQVEPFGGVRRYRAFDSTGALVRTTAVVAGGEAEQRAALAALTWPATPGAGGPLVLPPTVTSVVARGTPRLPRSVLEIEQAGAVRTALAGPVPPVPAGQECTLEPGRTLGLVLGHRGSSTVVLVGDRTCPQAVSSAGGRVRVPERLQEDLLRLITPDEPSGTDGDG